MSQVLGSLKKLCLCNKRIDFPVNLLHSSSERGWQPIKGSLLERDEGRAEDSSIESGKEDDDSPPIWGQEIAIGRRDSGDDALEPESPEIIGHLAGGVMIQTDSQKRSHMFPKATVGESIKEMDKQAKCQKETHHPWVSELETWRSLTVMLSGLDNPLDALRG